MFAAGKTHLFERRAVVTHFSRGLLDMSNTFSSAEQTTPVLERLPAIMMRTGLKRSSVYALIAAGYFPKPVKLSERSSAWIVKEVNSSIADRIAERDSGRRSDR
jgi:prophage regulatory protein